MKTQRKNNKLFINLFVGLLLLLTGCNKSNQDIAQSKIEEFVLKNANDAKSYEFIEMGKPDTIMKSDSIETFIKETKNRNLELLEDNEFTISRINSEKTSYEIWLRLGDQKYANQSLLDYNRYVVKQNKCYSTIKSNTTKIKESEILLEEIKEKELKNKNANIHKIIYTCHYRIGIPLGGLIKTQTSIEYFPNGKDKWSEVSLSDWDKKLLKITNELKNIGNSL
jgi:hypothetical protein